MRGVVVLVTALGVALVTAPGCVGHECEGDVVLVPYGERPTEGDFLDEASWESSPLTSVWLDFPGGRTWKFHIPQWEAENRPFVSMAGYVSPAKIPNQQVHCDIDYCLPADAWTEGTGNLVEFSQVSPGRFQAYNATCSPFFLRVVMRAGPPVSEAGPGDAGGQSE